jgi:hypothetical protein
MTEVLYKRFVLFCFVLPHVGFLLIPDVLAALFTFVILIFFGLSLLSFLCEMSICPLPVPAKKSTLRPCLC